MNTLEKPKGNPRWIRRREERKAEAGLGALYRQLEAERLKARKLTKREAKRLQVRTGLQVLHPRTKHAKRPGGLNLTIQAYRKIQL